MSTPDRTENTENTDATRPDVAQPDDEQQPKPHHDIEQDDELRAGQYGPPDETR